MKRTGVIYTKQMEGAPTYVTYYAKHDLESTADVTLENVVQVVGEESPIHYRKIENFVLYGIDSASLNTEIGEFGFDVVLDSEAVVIPNTVYPRPDDYFSINYDGNVHLFKIVEVQQDKLHGHVFYKVSFKLSRDQIDLIEKQVKAAYETVYDNIGTENRVIVSKQSGRLLEYIQALRKELVSKFIKLFYSQRYDLVSCRHNNALVWNSHLAKFLVEEKLLEVKRQYLQSVYVYDIFDNNFMGSFDEFYKDTVYRALQYLDPRSFKSENFYLSKIVNHPKVSFFEYDFDFCNANYSIKPISRTVGEVPSGAVDGLNLSFVLRSEPMPESEEVFVAGRSLDRNSDYVVNGSELVFVSPPPEAPFVSYTPASLSSLARLFPRVVGEGMGGLKDGLNRVFSINRTPAPGTEEVFLGGKLMLPKYNYSIVGNAVEFSIPDTPQPGQSLKVNYVPAGEEYMGLKRIVRDVPAGTQNGGNRIFKLSYEAVSGMAEPFLGGEFLAPDKYTLEGSLLTLKDTTAAPDVSIAGSEFPLVVSYMPQCPGSIVVPHQNRFVQAVYEGSVLDDSEFFYENLVLLYLNKKLIFREHLLKRIEEHGYGISVKDFLMIPCVLFILKRYESKLLELDIQNTYFYDGGPFEFVDKETATKDSPTDYSVSSDMVSGSEQVYVNGEIRIPGSKADYMVVAPRTIKFNSALQAGDSVAVSYFK